MVRTLRICNQIPQIGTLTGCFWDEILSRFLSSSKQASYTSSKVSTFLSKWSKADKKVETFEDVYEACFEDDKNLDSISSQKQPVKVPI
jgi:hypothetical protein